MKKPKSSKPRVTGAASLSAILGTKARPKPAAHIEPSSCYVCQVKLNTQRIEALRNLGTPPTEWMCVRCSNTVTTPRLGIFMGEVGTSELRIVDKLYTDSVREIFMEPDTKEEED